MNFKFMNGHAFYGVLLFLKSAMRILIFFCCTISFAFASNKGFSQNAEITIQKNQTLSIKEIYKLINKQTNYKFIYRHDLIKDAPKVALKKGVMKVNDLLDKCLLPNKLTYEFTANETVIVKRQPTLPAGPETTQGKRQIRVTGTITDEKGGVLPGATVFEKGTKNGTQADLAGKFSISVSKPDAVLVFSFLGFVSQEVNLNNRTTLAIVLLTDAGKLDEVVVIGYGSQSKVKVTGSIASLKADAIKDVPFTDVAQALAGKLAGVQVTQNTGAPGSAPNISIRGVATLTAGTDPLIVLDGLPLSEDVSIQSINPTDIASVEVLKDAASAAIYGSRASNGVILITTKKGVQGKTKFTYNGSYGIQNVAKKLDLLDGYELAQLLKEARDKVYLRTVPGASANDSNEIREGNTSNTEVLIPNYILPYLDGQKGLINTDWQDAIFRSAPIQSHEINASGGNENTTFFVSANFFDQGGIVVGSDFKRYSARVNLKTKFSDKLTFGINLTPSISKQNKIVEGWEDSPVSMGINSHPFFPVYNPDGSYSISEQIKQAALYGLPDAENVVAVSDITTDTREDSRLLGGAFLEYEIIEGLTAKTYFGGYTISSRSNYFRPSYLGIYRAAAPTVAQGRSSTFRINNWVSENTLNYKKRFNDKHNLEVLLGYSIQKENIEKNGISGQGYPNDEVETLNAATIINSAESSITEWALISYLGRVQYDYENKYLLSAAIRRDGSSRFGNNTQFGIFPSVSVGWRVDQEDFFPKSDAFSSLKFRGSWGVTGNNQIADFGSLALLGSANYTFNGSIANGLRPGTSPNSDLSWEESTTTNLGLDASFFKNKLSVSIDAYRTNTDGLLLNVPVPGYSGFESSLQNIGKIRNQGIESSMTYQTKVGQLQISSTANISFNRNKTISLGPGQTRIISGMNITEVGKPVGAHYGYKIIGIYETQQEVVNFPRFGGEANIGEYIFADLNNDGIISSDDRTSLGTYWPDYTWGFSSTLKYKYFDFNFSLQGVQGVTVRDRMVGTVLYDHQPWGNHTKDYYENAWRSLENPGKYAAPGSRSNILHRESNLFVDDASYLRVRNITLGVTLDKKLIKKLFLDNIRIYATAKNPFTFTSFRGYNPEQSGGNPLQPGVTLGNFPLERSVVLGVNVNF
ncbi:SusC/RagA family TonB-linked outer membrane protein [Pedobacter endophyticus]|uniref:TonB-dependent receptor n=1 Tax=Pedobacter endophyticus TaxID=2789740 RepID=A0A7U3SPF2_9SPHI|nr:TonB-dependent receptor [Pedobacter endophyticus]QPH38553.1 TonB-dependent receptor [Pedobacter endophyticus]